MTAQTHPTRGFLGFAFGLAAGTVVVLLTQWFMGPTTERPKTVTGEPDDKTYAVIGPLDGFTSQQDLQDMLTTLVRGWNLEETP